MNKKILISQNINFLENRYEIYDSLDHRFINLILNLGYLPYVIPNNLIDNNKKKNFSENKFKSWLNNLSPDGILLTGGNNIGTFKQRDQTELSLLNFAYNNKLPTLGICRGLQILASWAGGSLKKVEGHVGTYHNLVGEYNFKVNSFHNFSLEYCPNEFVPIAFSEDGEIEAIRHKTLNWEGWMWHPERNKEISIMDIENITRIFNY